MADGLTFDASDLDQFGKDLAAAQGRLKAERKRANDEVSNRVAEWSRFGAVSGTRTQRHFASAIEGRATARTARIRINATGPDAGANTAFWGAKRRTGWNAPNTNSRPQHPAWVGSSWTVGGPGGPYVINPAIRDNADDIDRMVLAADERALSRAFPGGFSR